MLVSSCEETRQIASAAGGGTVPTIVTARAPTRTTRNRVPAIAAAARTTGDGPAFRTTLCMSMRDSTASDSGVVSHASPRDALRAVALPFLVTRIGALLVGVAAAIFIGYTPEPGHPSAWRLDADPVRNLLARW